MNDKFLTVEDNILTLEEKATISTKIIENETFPFYYSFAITEKFKYFTHILVCRHSDGFDGKEKSNSPIYPFFYEILKRFCIKNNIDLTHVIRSQINASYPQSEYPTSDVHVDGTYDHKIAVLYMNDLVIDPRHNRTVIYDQKYSKDMKDYYDIEKDRDYINKNFTVQSEIDPKFGRMICFPGDQYHSVRWPKSPDLRYVCVYNFI